MRARLPLLVRLVAGTVLVTGVVFVAASYIRMRNNDKRFVMRGGPPELSTEVTSVVENIDRRESDGEHLRMVVRAARDTTFSDGHHELDTVHLEFYPPTGEARPDQISAQRAVYFPDSKEPTKGQVTFSGDVDIETRNALQVKTDQVSYNQQTGIAETSSPLTFSRENVQGSATGGTLISRESRLELHRDVSITVVQTDKKSGKPRENSAPVTIRSARAMFDQGEQRIVFSGGATAEQERDLMSGDTLTALLNDQKHVQKIEARGGSYLRSMNEGRAAEVHGRDMDFMFNADQKIEKAVATGDVNARTLNADSEVRLDGASTVTVDFQPQAGRSSLKELHTGGRTVITMGVPQSRAGDPKATSKRLTADTVNLYWHSTGRDLERAEAIGNSELVVNPAQPGPKTDRDTLTAPRFDCEFFDGGNLARQFTATGNARAVLDPSVPTDRRTTRTLTASKITAVFVRETQEVDRLDAQGDAKFNEADRNGRAENISYTAGDEMVRLRGGEPVVWDSQARTKAVELDSDTARHVSYGRGKVATTYYSQEQTGGALPFSKTKSPVYLVSDRVEVNHDSGVATYTGSARAWQDDNFVRADRLVLYRDARRMEGYGNAQTMLYQAKQRNQNGTNEVVPVFATSGQLWYSDADRRLHYERNVDIKQGVDRITSASADVYLQKEVNEVDRTVAERDVVLTQPGRKGTGEWAEYTAADDAVVLKGRPARVEDADQGTSESGRLTMYLRENRVIADSATSGQSTGRIRSTHKVRKP